MSLSRMVLLAAALPVLPQRFFPSDALNPTAPLLLHLLPCSPSDFPLTHRRTERQTYMWRCTHRHTEKCTHSHDRTAAIVAGLAHTRGSKRTQANTSTIWLHYRGPLPQKGAYIEGNRQATIRTESKSNTASNVGTRRRPNGEAGGFVSSPAVEAEGHRRMEKEIEKGGVIRDGRRSHRHELYESPTRAPPSRRRQQAAGSKSLARSQGTNGEVRAVVAVARAAACEDGLATPGRSRDRIGSDVR